MESGEGQVSFHFRNTVLAPSVAGAQGVGMGRGWADRREERDATGAGMPERW